MITSHTSRFPIQGLHCASCVGRAEKALAALSDVRTAQVNLATNTAFVDHDGPLAPLVSAVRGAGFEVPETTVTLVIEGASCASCTGRIEAALLAVPGVTGAAMNLATGRAQVTVAGDMADGAALCAAVAAAGYKATATTDGTPALVDEAPALRRDVLLAALMTLPVFVIEMGGHLFPAFHMFINASIGQQASYIIQFILTTLVLIGPGRRFYAKGLPALWRRAPDMNALVVLGASAAWGYSTIATFAPGWLPDGARAVYFEAAAVIVTLILLGRLLEARARGRTGAAITALIGLQPKTARVLTPEGPTERAVEDIRVGDLLLIRPGERVPTDGLVTEGASFVDEAMITGEPVPVGKEAGDKVTGGTINGDGALQVRATQVGRDTVLAQIIAMVEQAQGAKLPIQNLVDRITAWFVPAVLGIALATVLAWLALGPTPSLGHALVAGVAVLIIACPCAMGLATPTSIMVGTGRAAEIGVLFRRGDALQVAEGVDVVAFDKTGTLTMGHPDMTRFVTAPGFARNTVLAQIAGVEALSDHPVARAITRAAEGMTLPTVTDFAALPGFGLRARIGDQQILVGAERLMAREGVDLAPLAQARADLAAAGETPLYAAIDGQAAAAIGVSDPVKPSARGAIAALHAMGIKTAMITGDAQATADIIAAELGIDHVVAEVLPGGKVTALQALQQQGRVAFVGDGINDAPALAGADVGIAIGTGTDVAIEAADVVLMSGDLSGVVNAISVSRHTLRNIRQNLAWAFGYNIVLIPVAAGVLAPFGGPLLSPMLAAGAMALSSVFVLTNALRLRFMQPAAGEIS